MPLTPGSRIGPYEISNSLGVGGMGEVYRARDTKLGREVAIKVLPEALAFDPERIARFEREAQVLASLNHPHIAHLHSFEQATPSTSAGQAELGQPPVRFLVMELVEGETLAERIAQRTGGPEGPPIPIDEALRFAHQIAQALEAAHEKGIVHRDLKPANVKITPDDQPEPKAQSRKPIGMIGLGIMGSAMAANLMKAGHPVVGYDVVATRRRDHVRAGGLAVRRPSEVAKAADVVICSLPSAAALLAVADELAGLRPGPPIVIETSTLPIAVKEEARRRLSAAGTILLDCPLSGTGAQARVGDLVVYASGSRTAYRAVTPVMAAFARAHYYVGPFGAGSKMKFVANLLVAIHNVAAAEAMVLAMKAGLDPAMTLKVIADGAGSSRMLQVRGPMMVRGDYSDAMIRLSVWAKDMTIIGDFARQVGCPTPLFSATAPIYAAAALGRADEDTAAVCAVLEERAHHRRPKTRARSRRRK